MSGHGGARINAGRGLAEPDLWQRLEIGFRCEQLRESEAIAGALALAKRRAPHSVEKLRELIQTKRAEQHKKIVQLQERNASALTIRAMVSAFERYEANAQARILREIAPTLHKIGRVKAFRAVRPTRDEIQRKVAVEYKITPRRVKAYWTEAGHYLRSLKAT